MKPGPAFKVDPRLSRTISLLDLVFVAIGTFVVFPALCAGFGWIIIASANTFDADHAHPMRVIAEFILGMGYIGLFAWIGAPIAMVIGWVASRMGCIGWAVAPFAGAFGGLLFSLFFFGLEGEFGPGTLPLTVMFMSVAAIYAVAGWLSLRWLMPQLFERTRPPHK